MCEQCESWEFEMRCDTCDLSMCSECHSTHNCEEEEEEAEDDEEEDVEAKLFGSEEEEEEEPACKNAKIERSFFFSSESVNEGHPDKLCDQVSDSVLDTCLRGDPMSKVALWNQFGSLWDKLGVNLGSLWVHLGVTFGSVLGHFGIRFGVALGSVWDQIMICIVQ